MSKKATASILLLAFFINVLGYMNAYRFMVDKGSATHKRYLQKQTTLLIKTAHGLDGLSAKGFERRGKGEYIYKGQHYDVIEIDQSESRTIISLAHDSYEEELLGFLQTFFSPAAADQQSPRTLRLKHVMLKQYLPVGAGFSQTSAGTEKMNTAYFYHCAQSPFHEVLVPPPQPAA